MTRTGGIAVVSSAVAVVVCVGTAVVMHRRGARRRGAYDMHDVSRLIRDGDWGSARQIANLWLADPTKRLHGQHVLAAVCAAKGDVSESDAIMLRAVGEHKGQSEEVLAWLLWAQVYDGGPPLELAPRAEPFFRTVGKALAAKPGDERLAELFMKRCVFLVQRLQNAGASGQDVAAELGALADAHPKSAWLQWMMGNLFTDYLSAPERGLEHLIRAAALLPSNRWIRFELAKALLFARRAKDAEGHFAAALELEQKGTAGPDDGVVLIDLAAAQLAQGKVEQAERTLTRCSAWVTTRLGKGMRFDSLDALRELIKAASGDKGAREINEAVTAFCEWVSTDATRAGELADVLREALCNR